MNRLQAALKVISAISIMCMALLVFVSVFFRYFLNAPILMTEDLMAILLSLSIFTAYPHVTLRREHVSVDLLGGVFARSEGLQRLRRAVIDVVTLVVLGFIFLRMWEQAGRYRSRGTFSQTMEWPLWPVVTGIAILVGLSVAMFAVRILLDWFRPSGDRDEPADAEGSLF